MRDFGFCIGVDPSPELTERELIKLNALTAAFANGLQRRGTEEATALVKPTNPPPMTSTSQSVAASARFVV